MENRTIQLQSREYLRILQEERIADFKKSEDLMMAVSEVTWKPDWIPGEDFSEERVVYEKTIELVGTGRIFTITRNGKPFLFTWETNPDKVNAAVTNGIIEPEALTGKVISAIGEYRARMFERAYEDGIVSNKHQEKIALLDFWQQRVVLLQPLECLINTQMENKDIDNALNAYLDAVKEYKKNLTAAILVEESKDLSKKTQNLEQVNENKSQFSAGTVALVKGIVAFKKYDVNIEQELKKFLDDDIAAIKSLPPAGSLTNTTLSSLREKLSVMMITMAKQAQGINQNLTHARPDSPDHSEHTNSFIQSLRRRLWRGDFSLFRGYFNDVCENVMAVINNYQPDLHNPVLSAHQGNFAALAEPRQKEEKAQLKSITAITGHSHERLYLEFSPENRKALAVICQIEKADEIEHVKEGYYSLKKNQQEEQKEQQKTTILQETGYTNWWLSNASIKHTSIWKRIGYFAWNVPSGIIVTVFVDVPWGFLAGIFDIKSSSQIEKVKLTPEKILPDTTYSTISEKIKTPNEHVAYGIAYALGRGTRALVVDFFKGAELARKKILEFPAFIKDDYYVGGRGDTRQWEGEGITTVLGEIEKQFNQDIEKIAEEQRKQAENYRKKHTSLASPVHDRQFASPPYHLSPGEWEDILSATPRGLKSFANGILHPIHAKNPFAGLIYNLFYFAGGFAVWAPQAAPLPDFYKEASQWLGKKMAPPPHEFAQGVASAATQGPISAMVVEGIAHGPQSILGRVCRTVEESLVDISVIMFLAWSGGVLLKSVPVIGHLIREEVGDDAGYVTLATYGGKAGLLIHELCEAEELRSINEEHAEQLKGKWAQLANLADELEANIKKSLIYTQATKLEKNAIIYETNKITSKDNLLKAIERVRLLKRLTTHSHLLPYLPSRTKRELLQAAEKLFDNEPQMVMAVKNMLNPYKPYSIASRTFRVIIEYPLGLIRIICGIPFIGTGNWKQAGKDFAKKAAKDVTRLVRFLHGLGAVAVLILYAGVYTPLRAVADLVFNDLAARMEGWWRGNRHSISQGTSQAAAFISGSYYQLGEWLTPTSLYKSVTHLDPKVVMGEPSLQKFTKLFEEPKTQLDKNSTGEKDSPTSTSSLTSRIP